MARHLSWPGLFDRLEDFGDDVLRNILSEGTNAKTAFKELSDDVDDWGAAQSLVEATGAGARVPDVFARSRLAQEFVAPPEAGAHIPDVSAGPRSAHTLSEATGSGGEVSSEARAAGRIAKVTEETIERVIKRPFQALAVDGNGRAKWAESRFSEGTRFGVWYGALTSETTIRETAYHWLRRITAFQHPSITANPIVTRREIFKVRVDGLLVDLRGKESTYPGLSDRQSYALTHPVGAYLVEQGSNGLLATSARHAKGVCVAIFKPRRLSDPRHQDLLRYTWNPALDDFKAYNAKNSLLFQLPPPRRK